MKKKLMIAMAFLLLFSTVSALPQVLDININRIDGGGGFITSDINIMFQVADENGSVTLLDYYAIITYSSNKGGVDNVVVTDLNLGTAAEGTGYCNDEVVSAAFIQCQYTWTTAAIGAISDGNYWIDVNVYAEILDNQEIYDSNMDANRSFYVDNTVPACEVTEGRGNLLNWVIVTETPSMAAGSITTLFYSVDSSTVFSSTTTVVDLADNLVNGAHTYRCYGTDTAGNQSSVDMESYTYPNPDNATIVGGGGGVAVVQQSIADAIPDIGIPLIDDNPLIVGIVAVVAFLALSGSKKSRKRRKKKGRR